MSCTVIRWMQAFNGRHRELRDTLIHELERARGGDYREVAAESIRNLSTWDCNIESQVGLIVAKGSVIKTYPGDVWSVRKGQKLVATRYGRYHGHTECFCQPHYTGIIIRGNVEDFDRSFIDMICQMARKYNVAVYTLNYDYCNGYSMNIYRRYCRQ